MASNKLEEVGLNKRNELLGSNIYNNSDYSNNYNANHTRALSDNETPNRGRGTGVFLDTYNGGNRIDREGSNEYIGSGRIQNLAQNEYNNENGYQTPDTSGNIGMVNF